MFVWNESNSSRAIFLVLHKHTHSRIGGRASLWPFDADDGKLSQFLYLPHYPVKVSSALVSIASVSMDSIVLR